MTIESVTPQKVLELAQTLSSEDFNWLLQQLQRLAADTPLPAVASLDVAITLYLTDQCSLGKAAELAGVTRWEIIAGLEARGLFAHQDNAMSFEEMETQFEQLAAMGIL